MMKFGVSPLTNIIYYGQVNEKRPNKWMGNKKKDVTNEVIAAVFSWFIGNMEDSEGEKEEFSITHPNTEYELVMRRKESKGEEE